MLRTISTHVLDTVTGEPARGVPVRLEKDGKLLADGRTDDDGRLRSQAAGEGVYRLVFDVASYLGDDAFFPEAALVFRVAGERPHYHVPLLLSRFGYTTYRGS